MIEKVKKYIEVHKMINHGDKIVVAVSGGPDSMCLLYMLNIIKHSYNIQLYVAHVNHCLRDSESDEDEEYVKKFCEKNDIPFYVKRVDINKICAEKKISSETAGRMERYEFFQELINALKAQKVALAHNSNDQAETMLMRIMRGTGIEGLRGIRPVREEHYIRPLLILSRNEIEDFCKEKSISPRIDSSNMKNIYNRNKIRLELIPYIQENFNKDIIPTLNRLNEIVTVDADYLDEVSKKIFNENCTIENKRVIINKRCFNENKAILTRVIRKSISEVKGNTTNIETVHIYDVISLYNQGTGKHIMLPDRIVAENIYGCIHIYRKEESDKVKNEINEIAISKKDISDKNKFQLIYDEYYFTFEVIDTNENIKSDDFLKFFDYDKIKNTIEIRKRKDGDKFIPIGMKGSKKLKDFYIDLKIPKEERDEIPLICFDGHIAWILDYRVSEIFKIDKFTKNVLKISVRKNHKQGRRN